MKTKRMRAAVTTAAVLSALAGTAISAQDKYSLKTQSGIAFSDFRGYENWAVVSVAQTDEVLKVIVANAVMIDAYRAGVPGNDNPFPDGSKIAKLQWKPKKSTEAPFAVNVPETFTQAFLLRRTASDFRKAADGDTPCSIMTPRPTRSRPTQAPTTAGARVIRQ